MKLNLNLYWPLVGLSSTDNYERIVICTRLHYLDAFCQLATAMATNSSDGSILTIKEVADYLKVNERTVYRLAGAKKIPAFKVGGTWRFLRSDIDQWIKNQTTAG